MISFRVMQREMHAHEGITHWSEYTGSAKHSHFVIGNSQPIVNGYATEVISNPVRASQEHSLIVTTIRCLLRCFTSDPLCLSAWGTQTAFVLSSVWASIQTATLRPRAPSISREMKNLALRLWLCVLTRWPWHFIICRPSFVPIGHYSGLSGVSLFLQTLVWRRMSARMPTQSSADCV